MVYEKMQRRVSTSNNTQNNKEKIYQMSAIKNAENRRNTQSKNTQRLRKRYIVYKIQKIITTRIEHKNKYTSKNKSKLKV